MIGILIATPEEARPLVEALQVRCGAAVGKNEPFMTFACDRVELVVAVSGMGKELAFKTATRLLGRHHPDELINLGIAGALQPHLKIGGIYRVTEAIDWPEDPRNNHSWSCIAGRFADLPPARLVTSDIPVFSATLRAALQPFGDLVDMEGAAVARACAEWGVPLTALKGVSDRADDGGRERLRRNLDAMSTKLAALVIDSIFPTG